MMKLLLWLVVCAISGYVGYEGSAIVAAFHEPEFVLPPPSDTECKALAGIYGSATAYDSAFPDDRPPVAPRFLKHLERCSPQIVAMGVAEALGDMAGRQIKENQ